MEEQKSVTPETPVAPIAPASPSVPTTPPAPKRAANRPLAIFLVLAAIVLICMGLTAGVYLQPPTSGFVRAVTKVLPYPAVIVDGHSVSLADFLVEYDALVNYFNMTAPESMPSESELSINIVDTLVNKTAIQILAKRHGITLDPAKEQTFYDEVVAQSGEEAFTEQLKTTFGWTPEEFRKRVVGSVVLATQVSEWISADAETQKEAKTQADAAFARVEAGEDFATVAGDTSQDFSAAQGGDIGYINLSELPVDSWGPAVAALEIGQHSPVVETPESFLIFKVTDRIAAGEDEQIQLSVIVIPKKTLDQVVTEYLDEVKVIRLVGKKE